MPKRRALLGLMLAGVWFTPGFDPLLSGQGGAEVQFIRGDANADGKRDLSDAVHILGCAFLGTECPTCADAADANDDGAGNISDPIYLLGFLFLGGTSPPPPGDACGVDPTGDELDCQSFPRCAAAGMDTIPTADGDVLIHPIEHATLVLQWNQKTIYADPVGGADAFAGLPAPDVILVTHEHGDHFSTATLRAIAVAGTVLVVPQRVAEMITAAGGVGDVEEKVLANGAKATVGEIEIEAVPAYNGNHPQGRGNGYVLTLGGSRIYIAGDTADISEMRALEDIGCAFIPMNLPYTMAPETAASAVLEFQPAVVYPYHYRGQDTNQFKTAVEAESAAIEVRLRNWYP